jgi:hypothetical protein
MTCEHTQKRILQNRKLLLATAAAVATQATVKIFLFTALNIVYLEKILQITGLFSSSLENWKSECATKKPNTKTPII